MSDALERGWRSGSGVGFGWGSWTRCALSSLALAVALVACASLDGLDERADAADATPKDAARSDAGHDAATPHQICTPSDKECSDTGTVLLCTDGTSWTPETQCPYVCAAGKCSGTCVPGSNQCNGSVPQTCSATGTWENGAACPFVCAAGKCAGECSPGAMHCSGVTPQACDSTGTWSSTTPCPFVCQAGGCAGVCTPGDTQCVGNTPQTCDASGQWQSRADCAFVCTAGACAGACTPNATQPCGSVATCNGGGTETCDAMGTWGACSVAAGPCAATPMGWKPVALTAGACPAGFGFPAVYISNVTSSPYACSCACAGTQVCSGSALLNEYSGTACMGAPVESNLLTFSTACGPGGPAIEGGVGYSLSNVKIAPAPACSAANMATNKPSPALTNITVCTPNLACTGGACLDAVDAVSMCIAQAGAVTCPMGFSTRSIVALGVTDARACVGCACGSTLGCTFESLLTDNDVSCDTMNPYNFNATTGCVVSPAADSAPFNSCQATAMVTGSGGCTSVAASMSTGSVTLAAASTMTVCCP